MQYLTNSESLTGYRVKVERRDAFIIVGYTLIVPPGAAGKRAVPQFWTDVIADGRLARLKQASPAPPWALGLGSWDPECPKHGFRYTICIEQTPDLDLAALSDLPLFTKEIGASDWLRFETTYQSYEQRFWKDDPYKMLKALGYHFNMSGFSVGLHFDAYPPGFDTDKNPQMEFWITVIRPD
jgi:predicted transcriptional regulator YdeE